MYVFLIKITLIDVVLFTHLCTETLTAEFSSLICVLLRFHRASFLIRIMITSSYGLREDLLQWPEIFNFVEVNI